jgi:hypothetical protein
MTTTWYLPTLHGDISLKSKSDKETLLSSVQLSPTERVAVTQLRNHKTSLIGKAWVGKDAFDTAMEAHKRGQELHLTVWAPIEQVQAVLARVLKPGRKLLAVAMTDEGIQEVWRSHEETIPKGHPYRTTERETAEKVEEEDKKPVETPDAPALPPPEETKVATTVAAPYRGCPAPDFAENRHTRANRVLEAFLSDEQRSDWRRRGSFVATGLESGQRYILTSRDAREPLAGYGGRTLYNADLGQAFCVHDWDVPPAEELLALLAFLSVPMGERMLQVIPSVKHVLG